VTTRRREPKRTATRKPRTARLGRLPEPPAPALPGIGTVPDIWAEIRPTFELEWAVMLLENDLIREEHAMVRWRELVASAASS
jgi:hypothetical protein